MNTYEQRIANLKNALDIDKQIASAESEARAYRKKAKLAVSLADKLALQQQSNKSRAVAQKLRINYFSLIETMELEYPVHTPDISAMTTSSIYLR